MFSITIKKLRVILLIFTPINVLLSIQMADFGVQFPFFLIQSINGSVSFIPVTSDIDLLFSHVYKNAIALSALFWIFAACILAAAILFFLITYGKMKTSSKRTGLIIILSGLFFLVSSMINYSTLLSIPNILIVPIGIPILLVVGFYICRKG